MASEQIWLGDQALNYPSKSPAGSYVQIDGEEFYRIQNVDLMDDFFISLVSYANHWVFISTSGALAAGRTHSGNALFPYYTEDKILDSAEVTGHRAVFLITKDDRTVYWEPFARQFDGAYQLERNLYKNILGSTLVFEEINRDLGLAYRYAWQTSHQFGFVKKSWLRNESPVAVSIKLLDGIQNVLPYGVTSGTQNELSCLLDAYKKSELDADSGVALYTMSSLLTDKAEPSEALSATAVWSYGLESPEYLLSSLQLNRFRKGLSVVQEHDVHGRRGAYLVADRLELDAGQEHHWGFAADVNQGPADVANLIHRVKHGIYTRETIDKDIKEGQSKLRTIIGTADGFQVTSQRLSTAHHTANVLFNVMRGGLFDNNYLLSKRDLLDFCRDWNQPNLSKLDGLIKDLPGQVHYSVLRECIEQAKDPLLLRLFLEYLPLTFSRRHGDPSRPWNHFSIDVLTENNQKRLAFAGNWRDIFQNWEALSVSVPGFIDNMVCKFLSATTADGYNPYRITREGIDWERPELDNPWANIGYWGDHQIIYLLKLLELSQNHFPESLDGLMGRDVFAYANVPYRIKGFDALLENPYETIIFDHDLDEEISRRVAQVGADGRLVWVGREVYQVNLLEKLLATLLSKLTNFIPGGGIWMNTQRPEWNDANNALVGTGMSMVTLCYLHRFVQVFESLLERSEGKFLPVSNELAGLFECIVEVFNQQSTSLLAGEVSDSLRYKVTEQLGRAGDSYRTTLYSEGLSGKRSQLALSKVKDFAACCRPILQRSIRDNKREDGLYHAYNRICLRDSTASIVRLDEMLEGQVAVLSSRALSAQEGLEVLTALRRSALYTRRQHSYLLYPAKALPRFVDKNQILPQTAAAIPLLDRLMQIGDISVVETDEYGGIHFNGRFTKVEDVDIALDCLDPSDFLVKQDDREQVRQLFINTFGHEVFTGRSGGMYAYEGIGSIYWHMVSKLLLAVSEITIEGQRAGVDGSILKALKAVYEDVRSGIGFNKSPEVYGAFPTDPYSHTPGFAGARQPGMTGQVKEEVITRLAELGLVVSEGVIAFNPVLLRAQEFLSDPMPLHYFDVAGRARTITIESGQIGFTFCQVPVVVQQGRESSIAIRYNDGAESVLSADRLPEELSHSVFMKKGEVSQLTVTIAGEEE